MQLLAPNGIITSPSETQSLLTTSSVIYYYVAPAIVSGVSGGLHSLLAMRLGRWRGFSRRGRR